MLMLMLMPSGEERRRRGEERRRRGGGMPDAATRREGAAHRTEQCSDNRRPSTSKPLGGIHRRTNRPLTCSADLFHRPLPLSTCHLVTWTYYLDQGTDRPHVKKLFPFLRMVPGCLDVFPRPLTYHSGNWGKRKNNVNVARDLVQGRSSLASCKSTLDDGTPADR